MSKRFLVLLTTLFKDTIQNDRNILPGWNTNITPCASLASAGQQLSNLELPLVSQSSTSTLAIRFFTSTFWKLIKLKLKVFSSNLAKMAMILVVLTVFACHWNNITCSNSSILTTWVGLYSSPDASVASDK